MQSETISKLAEALALAQDEITGAAKSSVNPHFNAKYASLAEVWDAWQKVGPKNGLAVAQVMAVESGEIVLVTRLYHKTGEWIESRFPLRPTKPDMQGLGSATTYARRYCLAAMVGIAPEDDDGEAASKTPATKAPAKPAETKTDAWVAQAKRTVAAMKTRKEINEWANANVRVTDALKERDPAAHQAFQEYIDSLWNEMENVNV